ncbi:MAG: TlpA family protein disulfide reductase [Verrucomicrobia bacterium]|nr:TlpA family protein disulfide reductase [Verrucomicrobiota bacterium]
MIPSSKKSLSVRVPALGAWLLILLWAGPISTRADDSLLGKKAPDWADVTWINSDPLPLKSLAGKVVLVRWWTAPGCPFCSATAPALNEFYRDYQGRGLEVIGFYHHKSGGPVDLEAVKQHARRFGFQFPLAVDPGWRTLKQWWLNTGDEKWTSVSFLIDRRGIVRHIHPGGQYVKGDQDYAIMKSKIEELLEAK